MPVTSQRVRDTKYRIAETAMGMFLEQGYEKVTVEAVADAAEVSRRTVFRHFSGKVELPFPDHAERIALVERLLRESDPDKDPVEVVIAGTEASLRDFLARPELVLRRYQLTRVVTELRNREVIEHERYVAHTLAYLRERLGDDPSYQPMGLAAVIDAIHRSALGDWVRSGGRTDAVAQLQTGMDWVRSLVARSDDDPAMLVAVLPDSDQTRRGLVALRDAARDVL